MEPSPEIENVELSIAHPGFVTSGRDCTAFREFILRNTNKVASVTNSAVRSEDDSEMNYLSTMLFATTIEHAILSSMILDECSNKVRVTKAIAGYEKLCSNKFGAGAESTEDDFAYPLNCPENKLSKLTSDKAIFDGTLRSLITELYLNQSYQCLQKCVDNLSWCTVRSKELINACTTNKSLKHELRRNLVHLRKTFKNKVFTSDSIIEDLTATISDNHVNNYCKTRYSDKWQKTRIEQHEKKINDAQDEHIGSIQKYKLRLDHETRAHDEVDQFNKICMNESQNKIENMMQRYDTDMEAMDLAIQKRRILYDEALDRRIYLQNTFAIHVREINEWKKFKIAREKEHEYKTKMHLSAITVQAWWRGLLVRLQLGPYSPQIQKRGGKKMAKKED